IVAAAWLITLLAAVLLAAGLIYPSAASEAGLRRALADSPAGQTDVVVSLYRPSTDAAGVDAPVQAELQNVLSPQGGAVVRDWRGSATLSLAGLPNSQAGDQAVVGYLDGLDSHATLVDGSWPAERTDPSTPMQVV